MNCRFPCFLWLVTAFPVIAAAQQIQFASDEAAAGLRPERYPWHPAGLVAVLGDERGRKWDLAGRGISVRPDGKQLAVGGYGGVIYLMDAETLRLSKVLRGDASFLKSVHYAPSGDALFSVGSDPGIRCWQLDAEQSPHPTTIAALNGLPNCAAWSADGSTLVVRDRAIQVWRRAGGTGLAKLTDIGIGEEKPAERVPAEIRQLREVLGGRGMTFMSSSTVAVSSDGSLIAASIGGGLAGISLGDEFVQATGSSAVTAWRIIGTAVEKLWTIDGIGYVVALALSPDGHQLAVGTYDREVHLFDVAGGLPRSRQVSPYNAPVRGVCFDPRGETLAVAADSVQFWKVAEDPPALRGNRRLSYSSALQPVDMAFSPDGNTLFYVDGSVVRRWPVDEAGPKPGREEEPAIAGVHALGITPDGHQLVAAIERGPDGGVAVWDLTSFTPEPVFKTTYPDGRVDDIVISPDGRTFVFNVSTDRQYRLELWRLGEEEIERLYGVDLGIGHPGSFWSAAFSPDGSTVATGHRDGYIRTWDVRNGQLRRFGKPPNANPNGVGGLAFSPDGQSIASVDGAGNVVLWEEGIEGFQRRVRLGKHEVRAYAVAFSADGRLLASGDYSGGINVWDLATPESTPIKLEAHTSNITSLDFSPDGRSLLSAGGDGRVIVWNVPAAKPRHRWLFPGHVFSALYHPSGEYIFSANGNGTIYVWRP